MGENVNNEGNASEIPVINTVSAVPLRRVSQDEIRRYTPPGSVLAWSGGGVAPFGFVYCNGAVYDYVEQPEFKVLFEAIGTQYNIGGESSTQFRVPDLGSRTVVGARSSGVGVGDDALSTRTLGQTGGKEAQTLSADQLPPHTHRIGHPDDGGYGRVDAGYRIRLASGNHNTQDEDAEFSFPKAWTVGSGVGIGNTTTNPRTCAGPAPDEFYISDGMAGNNHPNMMPFLVLDYIIKI